MSSDSLSAKEWAIMAIGGCGTVAIMWVAAEMSAIGHQVERVWTKVDAIEVRQLDIYTKVTTQEANSTQIRRELEDIKREIEKNHG